MKRLALACLLLTLSAPASAQQRIIHDTLGRDMPTQITCGFCAGEQFGVIFRELPSGRRGLEPTDFPLTIDAVGRAANKMIEEVRRQFRDIPGLRDGEPGVKPDSARCVDISTAASLREMLIPGGLAVVVPLVIGFISTDALGGFLAGALVTGFALAIFMANAGGAWDNAKKYIEAGNHGGKGSDPHKAAVVGDTVGDPFKDTAGPAMNILIKVMTIVSLIFATAFV